MTACKPAHNLFVITLDIILLMRMYHQPSDQSRVIEIDNPLNLDMEDEPVLEIGPGKEVTSMSKGNVTSTVDKFSSRARPCNIVHWSNPIVKE